MEVEDQLCQVLPGNSLVRWATPPSVMEKVCTWTGDDQPDTMLVDRAVGTVMNGRTQEAGVKTREDVGSGDVSGPRGRRSTRCCGAQDGGVTTAGPSNI